MKSLFNFETFIVKQNVKECSNPQKMTKLTLTFTRCQIVANYFSQILSFLESYRFPLMRPHGFSKMRTCEAETYLGPCKYD